MVWQAEKSGLLQPMGSQSWTQLRDWKIPWDLLTQESNLHIPQQLHQQLVSLPLNHKEGWAPKILCFLIVVLKKTLESPLGCKEIQPVNPKENEPWAFTGRTDAEAEDAILWPSTVKSWLIRKDCDAGKDWEQEEKGVMRWLDSIINSMDMNLSKLTEIVKDRGAWHAAVQGVLKNRTWLNNWTTSKILSSPGEV